MRDEGTAERNAREIVDRGGEALARLMLFDAPHVARSGLGPARKLIRLQRIADQIGEIIAPNTPCKKGCAHCCYMATAVGEEEAKQIAAYTSRRMAPVADWSYEIGTSLGDALNLREREVTRWHGVACPFLKNNECSVYPVRPIACRTHHSLAATAEPCDIINRPGEDVPALNLNEFRAAEAEAMIEGRVADIREWFPCL